MLNPDAQGDDLEVELLGGDGLGYQSGTLMNRTGTFIKEMQESSLAPPTLWVYSEQTPYVNQEADTHSPDT